MSDFENKYRNLDYTFTINLYAVTAPNLYIPTDKEGEYYKVPREAYEGLESVNINDNVGTMVLDGKTYLVFDELLLFIRATREELQRYGIEKVSQIT